MQFINVCICTHTPFIIVSLSIPVNVCLPNVSHILSSLPSLHITRLSRSMAVSFLGSFLTGALSWHSSSRLRFSMLIGLDLSRFTFTGGTDFISFCSLATDFVSLRKINLQGISNPPCGRSDEYHRWLSVISQQIVPPSSRNNEHAVDDFLGMCPTTSLPFLMATAYGSFGFPLSCSYASVSPQMESKYHRTHENLWRKNSPRASPYYNSRDSPKALAANLSFRQ